MDIAEFLLARIAEDQAVAQAAEDESQTPGDPEYYWTAEWSEPAGDNAAPEREAYVRRFNPRRVLAECEARRRIVKEHSPFHIRTKNDGLNWDYQGCGACMEPDDWTPEQGSYWPCATLRLLALPHADHPAYQQEWKPL